MALAKVMVLALSLSLIAPAAVAAAERPAIEQTQQKPEPLTEAEKQELAQRAEEPKEVAGGQMSNQTLTYIVIALAAAVLVLVLK